MPTQAAIEAQLAQTQHERRACRCSTSATAAPAPRDAADAIVVSALTGAGLERLRHALLEHAGWQAAPEGGFIARTRHVQALRRRRGAPARRAGQQAQRGDTALELFAEELRLAHEALGEITGAFTSDDLLGEIFGRFCIGK